MERKKIKINLAIISFLILLIFLLGDTITSTSVLAYHHSPEPVCTIEVGDFCTQTQGGWGSSCSGNNPGCLRNNNWNDVIGGSLIVGIWKNITFTGSAAVENYLPAGGPSAALNQSYINPLSTNSGVLGGQVTALKLNVLFSDAGVGLDGGTDPIGELYIGSGKFTGLTVYQFLNLAERVLGGNVSALAPYNASLSDLNDVADKINKNFDDCDYDKGFLIDHTCPTPYCGDGIKNQHIEQCDDGNNVDGDGCSATCKLEGSISVCKIILDPEGNIVDGSDVAGDEFNIDSITPVQTSGGAPVGEFGDSEFTAPLPLNEDLLGDDSDDAQCFTYSQLKIGGYYYDQEEIDGSASWKEPKYNDQNSIPVNDLTDFFFYDENLFDGDASNDSLRNKNADGHIVLTHERRDRTLIVLNQYMLPVCGNEILENGEQCDDGNQVNGDGCNQYCEDEFCGDGITNDVYEQCDDGNINNNDGCSNSCQLTYCGDSTVQNPNGFGLSEFCDDGNNANGDGCNSVCQLEYCGDTIIQPLLGEQCDDGNYNNDDACSNSCDLTYCGDSTVQNPNGYGQDEQCDDGNTANGDGCSSVCQLEFCGDGTVQIGEQCDDGNNFNDDGCSTVCQIEYCGDDILQSGEQCDDGNYNNNDACTNSCYLTYCGDDIVQNPNGYNQEEQCDDGNTANGDGCNQYCEDEFCGDDVLQVGLGETCDDGNNFDDDGCNSICQYEYCGDGVQQISEACDDGNTVNGDGCNSVCYLEYCGDFILQPALGETCDDGNQVNGDGCNAVCMNEYCGDNVLQPLLGEQCDDGNIYNNDGCSAVCQIEYCGDDILQSGEQCDDGNQVNGDGCDSACVIEYCGDGILQPSLGETCDDGNNVNGDGCSVTCEIEVCVDENPPYTKKYYGLPYYSPEEVAEWINSDTPIELDATDNNSECPSTVYKTYWRNTIVADEYCLTQDACQDAQGSGPWNEYLEPFYKPKESCHLIEYFSVDNAGNVEPVKKQCVYVDNQGPIPNKIVGEPKEIWDGVDAWFYDIGDRCWNNEEGEIECWRVTLDTPITMKCEEPQPHPVGGEMIAFNVELDGDDATEKYCEKYGGVILDNGFCKINENELTIYFSEESEHNLDFYCIDTLGNIGPVDEEKFKVQGNVFNIILNKKWNLISTPFALLDDSVEKVFEDIIEEGVIAVWTYDGDEWLVYTPDDVENDDLESITPGWGYWVLMDDETVLVIGGELFTQTITPTSKEIVPGWNLIGYYGNDEDTGSPKFVYDGPDGDGKSALCALGSLLDTVFSNPKWDALVTYWEPYNPDQWTFLNQVDYMDPGAGYWIYMDIGPEEKELYTYSTTCSLLV